jgi:hypothetical protein
MGREIQHGRLSRLSSSYSGTHPRHTAGVPELALFQRIHREILNLVRFDSGWSPTEVTGVGIESAARSVCGIRIPLDWSSSNTLRDGFATFPNGKVLSVFGCIHQKEAVVFRPSIRLQESLFRASARLALLSSRSKLDESLRWVSAVNPVSRNSGRWFGAS